MKLILRTGNLFIIAASLFLVSATCAQQTPNKLKGKQSGLVSDKDVNKIPLAAPSTDPKGDDKKDPLEQEILPVYDNYLKEYRLGPSDVISIEVFGQCPDYCKTGITIPPNARISYPLIREGVLVAGKTVEQIADEVTKKLDEFIIDPKVTVTLDKAVSTRYSVMGNVTQPGVRVMERRVSVYEAVLNAGGVTHNGDKNKVAIVSYGENGHLERRVVSLTDMEKGKSEMVYVKPGDQVYVMGKGFSIQKVFEVLTRANTLRYMIPGLPNIPYALPYGL